MLLRLPRRKLRRLLIMLLPFLLTLLLLTPLYIIYKPPNLLIRYFQHRWPDVLFHVPPPHHHDHANTDQHHDHPDANTKPEKLIALTIDDAPSPYTLEIKDLLSHHSAHATFFLIGSQIPAREETLHELLRAGHELANHAMRDEPSRSLSPSDLESQILAVQDSIRAAYSAVGAREPTAGGRYFRPGSGFFSAVMRDVIRRLGFRIVLGSVYPHDAQVSWPWVNARHILSMVREGSIVVCHDRREWTVPMLGVVLPELRRRGYRVVTVSELLEAKGGIHSGSGDGDGDGVGVGEGGGGGLIRL